MNGNRGFKRADRISRDVQRVLSTILLNDVADPALRKVVITAVKVTDDLRNAHVFWQPLSPDDESVVEPAEKAFARASARIRSLLSKALTLRYTPRLRFEYDHSIDQARRMDDLFQQIQESPSSGPEHEPGE